MKWKANFEAARQARYSMNKNDDESTTASVSENQAQLETAHVSTSLLSQQSHTVQNCSIDGCRIVNVAQLAKNIYDLTAHSATCGGACYIEGETNAGLAVVFSAVCSKCEAHYTIRSSHQITASDGKKCWAVNMAAVLGQISTGGGHARLNSTLATLDIPGMSKRMFTSTEDFLGREMKMRLLETMVAAAEDEQQHAISTNHFHQAIPAVCVVADAGWSKRTHKHSYNAKRCVAVIFGVQPRSYFFSVSETITAVFVL